MWCNIVWRSIAQCSVVLPVVPHKAVAEVSKIGNVNQGWQSESTDGPKGA